MFTVHRMILAVAIIIFIGQYHAANALAVTGNIRYSLPFGYNACIANQHCLKPLYSQTTSSSVNDAVDYQQTITSTTTESQAIDWKLYSLQQNYKRSGGILYKQSILTPNEYATIMNEMQSLDIMMQDEKESSFATNRVGAQISKASEVFNVLSCDEGNICRLVNSLADGEDHDEKSEFGKLILAPDIPIEVRVYEKTGAGMEWHIDDVLYKPEQIEVVLTLENDSDCDTMWKPHDRPLETNNSYENGSEQQHRKYNIQSAQTTPNSALILKAGGVEHKVSPLTVGKRTILKMAFVREGAVLVDGMDGHVSHHNDGGKKRKSQGGSRIRSKSGKGGNSRSKHR